MARKRTTPNPERESQLLKAAYLYYKGGLTQGDIANQMGFSRPTVVRMLQKARESGLVEIRITKDLPQTISLEAEIESALAHAGLQQAVVVEAPGHDPMDAVARGAAHYLRDHLRSDHIIGIGSSATLSFLPDHIEGVKVSPNRIVQLGGHAGAPSAQDISIRLGALLRAPVDQVPAPVIVGSTEIRDALYKDPIIRATRKWASRCNLALVGVGVNDSHSRLIESGYLKSSEFKALVKQGVVGEILSHYYDIDGKIITAPWADRSLTVSLQKLRSIDNLVAVAAGAEKARSVLGAIRAGIVTTLIVDTDLARALLKLTEAAGKRRTG